MVVHDPNPSSTQKADAANSRPARATLSPDPCETDWGQHDQLAKELAIFLWYVLPIGLEKRV